MGEKKKTFKSVGCGQVEKKEADFSAGFGSTVEGEGFIYVS